MHPDLIEGNREKYLSNSLHHVDYSVRSDPDLIYAKEF